MEHKAHEWVDGEMITAEKLNELEEAAARAAQPGIPGVGLAGEPSTLLILDADADATTVLKKVNEIVGVLIARGISREAGV